MSRYGYLACVDTKEYIWLGKAIFSREQPGKPAYFHLGSASSPKNWENLQPNRMIDKFLADHQGLELRVFLEHELLEDYVEIGGNSAVGIGAADYLIGWPGS